MRSVAEHRRRVLALGVTTRSRSVGVADAMGTVLDQGVTAPHPLPRFSVSAVDGFAMAAEDLKVGIALRVQATRTAGPVHDDAPVRPGCAVQIMTGAQVPVGADVVVPVEATSGYVDDFANGVVRIDSPFERGANIRPLGSDIDAGETLVRAGTTLSHNHIAALAAVGLSQVEVRSQLRVAVVPTGSELVVSGHPLRPGQIHESNATMIAADLTRCGAQVRREDIIGDDIGELRGVLERCAAWADLIVTSGGVSAGTEDVVRLALENGDAEFVPVAMKPGKPQGAGDFRGTPIICLPGNPVSSFVSYEVFVRPVVRDAMGHMSVGRPTREVRLDSTAITGRPGRAQYVLGTLDGDTVVVSGTGASGSISSLAAGNCLIVVDELGAARGSTVTVWHIDRD